MLPKSSPCLVMRHTNGGLRFKVSAEGACRLTPSLQGLAEVCTRKVFIYMCAFKETTAPSPQHQRAWDDVWEGATQHATRSTLMTS